MKRICVVGSINIDLVTKVNHFPQAGETITGNEIGLFPGGKGANQAVAAGKLGGNVTFLGKVGNDYFGSIALKALSNVGVNTDYIETVESQSTGTAVITVNGKGENHIIIVPGANAGVDIEYIKRHIDIIEDSDILLLQLEIPIEIVEWVAAYAKSKNTLVILDPAPAQVLSNDFLGKIDILTPNETELEIISGMEINDRETILRASESLLNRGVGKVINKAGKIGAYYIKPGGFSFYSSYDVKVVDTTAAGDSFNAGLAVGLAKNNDIEFSIDYANAVASLSVTEFGAQSAMPDNIRVLNLMKMKEAK